jgi:HSP20 family protein
MLDRLWSDVMNDVAGTAFGAANGNVFEPAIDVRANDDAIVFVCDVPGLSREDLEITLDGGVLSIQGQRRFQANEKDRVVRGRRYGAFVKRFTLPDHLDEERLTADLADGVLTITIPKQPRVKPRRIDIGGAKQLGETSDKAKKE